MSFSFSDKLLEEIDEEQISLHALTEALAKIFQKWPGEFYEDFLRNCYHYLALADKGFRTQRSLRHELRIICSHYFMRKTLLRRQRLMPNELDVECRLLPTQLSFTFGQQPVLGIVIAIHLSSSYQRFEDSHALLAVQKLLPVQMVKGSFLIFQKPGELLRFLYVEVEKTPHPVFSLKEIRFIKQRIKEELKRHVETLSPSLFGMCDVEETMRNILSLCQELDCPCDIPQVMISFERVQATTLVFRIVVVRALTDQSKPLADCFRHLESSFEFVYDCSSKSQFRIESTILKEASVFRLHIPKQPFLVRSDSSFNFYHARQHVLSLLIQALGDVRDYNGGIFSKQLELFTQFKQHFKEISDENQELLEDFFYALRPPEMQAVIPLYCLQRLFGLFVQINQEKLATKQSTALQTHKEADLVFAVVRFRDPAFQEFLERALKGTPEPYAWMSRKDHDGMVWGYIYHSSYEDQKEHFCQIFQHVLRAWTEKIQSVQVLRLSPQHLPVTLDPRLGGDEISSVVLKMLFEGLARIGKDGQLHLAAAKSVVISEDGKRYTFKLRECTWSNGDQVTAHDFCYTWKKILSPDFTSPFAYLFYVILHAKKAKKGWVSLDAVGIEALDDGTLVVQLEHFYPSFLELTAHPFYAPVNHRIDRIHPNWSLRTGNEYVCNGPFQLELSDGQEGYELKKNMLYWDHAEVRLERIQISRSNSREAFNMFHKGETDWLGRPIRAWEPFFSHNIHMQLEKIPFNTSYWYVFNTKQFPFQSRKMRQAFASAIDRQAIIDLLSCPAIAAFTPLPLGHTQFPNLPRSKRTNNPRALLEEALKEIGKTRHNLPPLVLIHPNNDLRKKIAQAIVQQWKESLDIAVEIESYSFKHLFTKMTEGDYQIGAMSWWPKLDDPLYTLDALVSSDEPINFCKWENSAYKDLIQKAHEETAIPQRNFFLAKAEALLIQEVPIVPLLHEQQLLIQKNYVEGVFPSKVGNIDFKYVYINNKEKYANNNQI